MSFSKSEIAFAEAARAISAFWKPHSYKLIPNWTQNRMITYTNFTPTLSAGPGHCVALNNENVTLTMWLSSPRCKKLITGKLSHSHSWVQAFVISIRCAKCTAGAKSNGSIRRRTSARCMLISRTSLSFSRTSMDFSTLAKFDSLKLTETIANYILSFAYSFYLISYKLATRLKLQFCPFFGSPNRETLK